MEQRAEGTRSKVDLIDRLGVLFLWRRFILINFVAATAVAVIVSLLLPKWYKSTATLLPPKQPDLFGSFGAASSGLRSLSSLGRGGGLGQRQQAYNYFAILKSRTASEAVIRKFDLMNEYGISDSSMEKTIKELEGNVSFEEQTDDYISVEVLDKDPRRAADMANFYVELLNQMSTELGTTEAKNNREFIGARLDQARQTLALAEDTLRNYQEKSGIMISPEQSATVGAIASLYGMKAKKEVELAVLERTMGSDTASVQQARIELAELNRKLSTFPEIGLESFRLYRDVAIQEKILEFLLPVYEQARIEEQKDVPVLLVLDHAVPAEKKSRPQRVLITLVVAFLSLVSLIPLVLWMEGVRSRRFSPASLGGKFQAVIGRITLLYRVARAG